MTTSTVTPRRAGTDGFEQLLHAEWTKFRTVRGWVIAIIATMLAIMFLGWLTASGSHCTIQGHGHLVATGCPSPPVGPGGEFVTDEFYFVHQPLDGNGSITVRVTSLTGLYNPTGGRGEGNQGLMADVVPGTTPWSKAGIIIKDGTRPGSAYAAMMVTGGHGVRMQWDYTEDSPGLAGRVSAASPRWLRLTRSGDTITGYDSADGTHWARVGTAILAGLPSTVQAGLFAASPFYQVTTQSLGASAEGGGPTLATPPSTMSACTEAGLAARGPARSSESVIPCCPRQESKPSARPTAGSPSQGPATSHPPPAASARPLERLSPALSLR